MSLETEVSARELAASAGEAAPKRNARSRDFDQELGAKLRAARVSAGMNQTALGKALGISFQQVHKYESGIDRIAAGTLQKIGGVLGIHPGDFFGETAAPVGGVAELREAMSIAATMQKIASPSVRKRFIALIEELAETRLDRAPPPSWGLATLLKPRKPIWPLGQPPPPLDARRGSDEALTPSTELAAIVGKAPLPAPLVPSHAAKLI